MSKIRRFVAGGLAAGATLLVLAALIVNGDIQEAEDLLDSMGL